MRIISLNTWKCDGAYRLRLEAMAAGLAALRPDLVLLQEAFRSIDGRLDTAARLAEALGLQVQGHWQRRKPRQCEGEWVDSESGMAVLSRQPLAACVGVALPGHPQDAERLAQWLNLGSAERPLWWGHVHLSHLPEATASGLRTRQLQALLAHEAVAEAPGPLWLMGDFNTDLAASGWQGRDLGPWRLADALAEVGLAPKRTHCDRQGGWQDLDHLLVLRRIRPLRGDTAGAGAPSLRQAAVVLDKPDADTGVACSDHLGLCVDLWEGPA